VRVGPARCDKRLALPHADALDMPRRQMKGWIAVSPAGYASDNDIEHWLNRDTGLVKMLEL